MLADQQTKKGAGIRILTETVTSPSTADLLNTIKTLYPAVEMASMGTGRSAQRPRRRDAGLRLARQHALQLSATPNVVVSLDSDFLAMRSGLPALRARVLRRGRVVGDQEDHEPAVRGGAESHRHRVQGRSSLPHARGGCGEFRFRAGRGIGRRRQAAGSNPKFSPLDRRHRPRSAANKGASLVIAGDQQPPAVHALAHAMNAALGNVGKTVFYTDPIEANPVDQVASLHESGRTISMPARWSCC